MAAQDRMGVMLALHESYLRGEISYDEYNRRWLAGWAWAGGEPVSSRELLVWQKGLLLLQKGPRGHVGVPDPVIVSLRIGDEPQPPRDWPTAIVTKWSGKR